MIYYESKSTDPYFNLALEEHFFRALPRGESFFMLWQNRPSVIVGRFQNAAEEVDGAYLKKHGISLARRLTGGGAVYHDGGNLNFTFIVPDDGEGALDFSGFARPVIRAMASLGVEAGLSGRNDILIGGRKICGNAQHSALSKKMHHGCIMLDTDLEAVAAALAPRDVKFESRGIKSVRSRVTTINDNAPRRISMDELKAAILREVRAENGGTWQTADPGPAELAEVERLAREKYASAAWIYGSSPAYNASAEARFAGGSVCLRASVSGGIIENVKISGDFVGDGDIAELEAALAGLAAGEDIEKRLAGLDVEKYMRLFSAGELAELIGRIV